MGESPVMTDIVIAAAARTPVGSFSGAFASLPAHALGAIALQAAMQRAGISPDEVDEVILGQVLYGGDDLSGEEWSDRNWATRTDIRENLFWLAAEACLSL